MPRITTTRDRAVVQLAFRPPLDLLDAPALADVKAAFEAFQQAEEALARGEDAMGEVERIARQHEADARAAGAAGRKPTSSIDPAWLDGRRSALAAEVRPLRAEALAAAKALEARIVDARQFIRAARVAQLAEAHEAAVRAVEAARVSDDRQRALASEISMLDANAAIATGGDAQAVADHYRFKVHNGDPMHRRRYDGRSGQTNRAESWATVAECAAGLPVDAYRADPFEDDDDHAARVRDDVVMTDAQRRLALLRKADQ